MQIKEFYGVIGSNYQKVFARLCSNAIITKFLKSFMQDESYDNFISEYKKGNLEDAFRAAYMFKGLCLNLGFESLSQSSIEITKALRGGKNDVTPQMIEKLTQNYNFVVENIKNIDD